ncbi:MAG: hypothetical protein AABP62_04425 [Planctomycetota bacterium]
MKSLIQIVLVALVMGGVSAAGSLYWKQWFAPAAPAVTPTEPDAAPKDDGEAGEQPHEADPAHGNSGEHPKSGEHTAAATHAVSPEPAHSVPAVPPTAEHATEPTYVPPVAARPPYVAEGDEAGQLITALRARVKAVDEAEVRLAERQSALMLIFDDLRSEQVSATRIRQQVLDESLQSRRADDAALRQSSPKVNDAASVTDTSGSLEENANLKKMASVYDTMPPENTAKVFQQLVKSSKTAAVVSLLNAMKERQTSKVLALISETDPVLAADLTERLKRLKTGPAPQTPQ